MFYFTPQRGFFSPFLRSTISLSVTQEYLALRGGPRGFNRDFTCPGLLGIQLIHFHFRLRDFHPLWCSFQLLRLASASMLLSHNPRQNIIWFRLFPLRSPLLRESTFLSLPPATKMFQFAGLAHITLYIQVTVLRVAPFGYPRINACFQLPGAFRR
jgi:hypothetical protein